MKKSDFDKQVFKDMLYGYISELANNPDFYYYSTFGEKYCHMTEQGAEKCVQIFEKVLHEVRDLQEQEYIERKKLDTFEAFKKN